MSAGVTKAFKKQKPYELDNVCWSFFLFISRSFPCFVILRNSVNAEEMLRRSRIRHAFKFLSLLTSSLFQDGSIFSQELYEYTFQKGWKKE